MTDPGMFSAVAIALYAGHHVGDYWVQTDGMAGCKGKPGREGRGACLAHVVSYLAVQAACLGIIQLALGFYIGLPGLLAGLGISGVTHYMADRREYGLMFWIAKKLGKGNLLALGAPRSPTDNPQLATGAWALDQSWHIFWGVFVASILAVTL